MGKKTVMTIDDVKQSIGIIKKWANSDPEAAHAERDDLYFSVIREIARSEYQTLHDVDRVINLAKEAMKASKIKLKWEACS